MNIYFNLKRLCIVFTVKFECMESWILLLVIPTQDNPKIVNYGREDKREMDVHTLYTEYCF